MTVNASNLTLQAFDDRPDGELLAQVFLVQDLSGKIPPKLITYDAHEKLPRTNGYFLNAKLIKLGQANLLALLKGESRDWDLQESAHISPIDLEMMSVGDEDLDSFKGAIGKELKELLPSGVRISYGVCYASRKEDLVSKLVDQAAHSFAEELQRLQTCSDHLAALKECLVEERPNVAVVLDTMEKGM